jgi:hypothetical protein
MEQSLALALGECGQPTGHITPGSSLDAGIGAVVRILSPASKHSPKTESCPAMPMPMPTLMAALEVVSTELQRSSRRPSRIGAPMPVP